MSEEMFILGSVGKISSVIKGQAQLKMGKARINGAQVAQGKSRTWRP